MRFRRGVLVIATLVDGQVLEGVTSWSWRWRVMRLEAAVAKTSQGDVATAGIVLIPYRSVLVAQEVANDDT